jgi:hypothetical protein
MVRISKRSVREPRIAIVNPKDAIDIAAGLIRLLCESGVMPVDSMLFYNGRALLRYLGKPLPPGTAPHGEWGKIEKLAAIDYTLSDRARYEPRIAEAAAQVREWMRGFVVGDKKTAFAIANFLRQTALEQGIVVGGGLIHRHILALLDFIENNGTPAPLGTPSYANWVKIPKRTTCELKVSERHKGA